MTDAELLLAIRSIVQEELKPVNEILNAHTKQLSEINESMGIVIDWIDEAARDKHLPPFASGQQM